MTITTDANNTRAETNFDLNLNTAQAIRFSVGIVQNNTLNNGSQVFLGVSGEHGTTIRLKDSNERKVLACLLEMMAEELRKEI